MRADKRVCFLTGASGTLGNAFCRLYASDYHIVGVYHSKLPSVPSQLQELIDPLDPRKILCENNNPIYAVQADLADDREIQRVVDIALARFDRIDVLVNAAVYAVWSPMLDGTCLIDSINKQFYFNSILPLKLALAIAQTYWRFQEGQNSSANRNVINVSSIAGINVYPNLGQSVYSASKAALNFLSMHMANEFLRLGVRVNALAPNSFPQLVSTDSVAQAVNRLDRGTMNGKILIVDRDGDRYM